MSSLFILAAALVSAPADDPADVEYFETNIRPLLVESCYGCHSSRANRVRGGLFLDSQDGWMQGGDTGPALVPGDPDASLLIRAVRYDDPDLQMPPKKKLPDAAIQRLEEWVARGAPDPRVEESKPAIEPAIDTGAARDYWAFRAPERAPVPSVAREDWPRGEVDRFVLAALDARGLAPVGDAEARTWLRRVTFDLTGLPPTTDEMKRFLADASPEARANVVDRLLASERFGERWGRYWLDVARYGESTGMTRNYPFWFAWRYRDWVIDAWNADMPYDRFLTEQIAGDLLPAPDDAQRDAQRTATGFLALGPKDLNERNALQYAMDTIDEQLDTLCRATLALTVGCARCHDHKFDPIPTRDYYALAGIFRSTDTLVGLTNRGGGGQSFQKDLIYLAAGGEEEEAPDEVAAPRAMRALEELRGQMRELRRELQVARRVADGADRRPQRARRRAREGADAADDPAPGVRRPGEIEEEIARVQRRLRQAERRAQTASGPPPAGGIMGVRDARRPQDARICVRGEVTSLGDAVPRGFLGVLGNPHGIEIPADASGRLELARWIACAENPLTARVIVNRVWQHLFGEGLAASVDNFGATGARPTHPELLDHLALRFVAGGWSLKSLIRELVLTRTYGLSTAPEDANLAIDPDGTWLWRMRPRRLDAEGLRDALLAVSGELVLDRPESSPVAALPAGEVGREPATATDAGRGLARSVYLPIVRGFVPEELDTFDFAEPSIVTGRRDVTTVATQALYFLNSEFVRDRATRLAERLAEAAPEGGVARVALAYELAFARPPTESETARALAFVEDTPAGTAVDRRGPRRAAVATRGWTDLAQALFASAEFRYVH